VRKKIDKNISKSIEVEGCTVEDAIKKAIEILDVSRDEISVKVVCEEKRGLFGMAGEKPAKIKVTIDKENK
jgi:spoIIIJ-associated protein